MQTTGIDKKVSRQTKLTTEKISHLCSAAFDRVELILDYFGIEYVEHPNRLTFPCPIHNGDNKEGCCIFTDGNTNRGNWACWTKHCEEEYANNLFGFVRGCLAERSGRNVSMVETSNFLKELLKIDLDNVDIKQVKINTIDVFNKRVERKAAPINRDQVRGRIQIPSSYYIGRGFKPETLDMFDVGDCLAENQPMSNRVVVPVYDEGYNYVGCVGRAKIDGMKPKWLHSKGFSKNVLYGLNLAKDHILKSRTAILVEGQGDVWKLHESGLNMTVGIFGSSINDDQLILLEESGALNLIILTDTDEAGEKAYRQIVKKCGRRFNYFRPNISAKDVGEMTVEQIKNDLYPQLKGILKHEH